MIKIGKNSIAYYMFLFLPTIFSIGRFIPIIETFATLLTFIVLIYTQGLRSNTFFKYIFIGILFVISGSMGTEYSLHIDHIKSLVIIFLTLDAVDSDLYDEAIQCIEENVLIIKVQLYLILFANVIFMFIDAGYSSYYSEMWAVNAYQGIYGDPHQCAYHVCALMVIMLWASKIEFNQLDYLICFGYAYCAVITGARVPAILAVVFLAIFVIDHFVTFSSFRDVASKVLKYMLIIAIGLIGIYLLFRYTTFGVKTLNSITSGSWDSGRSSLRTKDLELFTSSDILHKLFGYGTDAIYSYHGSFAYSPSIWSHNDFTQILVGMGLIMFCIYAWSWIKQLIRASRESILSVIVVLVLIVVAFSNGLYIHIRLVFVLPLLFRYMRSRRIQEVYDNELNEG